MDHLEHCRSRRSSRSSPASLILIMPRLLNYIVAIYLIIIGLLGLFPQLA